MYQNESQIITNRYLKLIGKVGDTRNLLSEVNTSFGRQIHTVIVSTVVIWLTYSERVIIATNYPY